jgi:D-alanine transaminase
MQELIWINAEVGPLSDARIGVEDRGYQFADGVYEVFRVYNGRVFQSNAHLARLERSAGGIRLPLPVSRQRIHEAIDKLVAQSGLIGGIVYLQLTRGCCVRNHLYPSQAKPTLLFYTRSWPDAPPPGQAPGLKLKTLPDERWRKCWIKSIALLPNVLAKNEACDAGFDEAVFVEDAQVSEGSSSNVFAIIGKTLIAPPPGPKVLGGITREVVTACARAMNVTVEDRLIRLEELWQADEVFITSTTREIAWCSQVDSHQLPPTCGPITRALHEAYLKQTEELAADERR